MIITVTLNAALDVTYRVPALRPHTTHRVLDVAQRPGGKGVNVARVLAALGHRAVVTGFAGGPSGAELRRLLAAADEPGSTVDPAERAAPPAAAPGGSPADALARLASATLRTMGAVGAVDQTTDDPTPLNEPGPTVGPAERAVPPAAPAGSLIDALVPIAGTTRRTIGVVDEATGDATLFNEPGPTVAPAEWAAFLGRYRELLAAPDAEAVALCGSLPPGLPVGAYAELVREARSAGVFVLLDTSGEPLRRGLAARPDLIKPNADELSGLTGSSDPAGAVRAARRRGARAVAASLGAEGMLLVTGDGGWRALPPARLTGNPTGAGDSAVAGLLSGLAEGLPWPRRLARAVALSAATVTAPAAGEFDRAAYEDALARVRVVPAATP